MAGTREGGSAVALQCKIPLAPLGTEAQSGVTGLEAGQASGRAISTGIQVPSGAAKGASPARPHRGYHAPVRNRGGRTASRFSGRGLQRIPWV